jgi:anti-sigma factor RsiW
MRCEELRSLLDLYLDGELPEEAAQKLDRHLLRCPACTYEVRTLEQTRAMLREAVEPTVTAPGFRERALARLLNALEPSLHARPRQQYGRQRSLELLQDDEQNNEKIA